MELVNPPLRTVRLYGRLGARFGRMFRLALDTNSPAEAVRALCAMLPGFEQHLMSSKDRGEGYAVFVGKRNLREEELKLPAGDEDIRIAPMLVGAKNGGVFSIILGVVLVVIGVIGNIYGGWGTPFIQAGIAMIAGGVVQLLAPVPKGLGSKDSPNNTPSYAFNGPLNTQAQGHPVPLLYGKMIVGSAVVSAGIDTKDTAYAPATPRGGFMGGGGGGARNYAVL